MQRETLGPGRGQTLGEIGEALAFGQKAAKEADIFRCLPQDSTVVF